ncbi:hypothetical protein HK101_006718, partial [Irineochytrium annulatum]
MTLLRPPPAADPALIAEYIAGLEQASNHPFQVPSLSPCVAPDSPARDAWLAHVAARRTRSANPLMNSMDSTPSTTASFPHNLANLKFETTAGINAGLSRLRTKASREYMVTPPPGHQMGTSSRRRSHGGVWPPGGVHPLAESGFKPKVSIESRGSSSSTVSRAARRSSFFLTSSGKAGYHQHQQQERYGESDDSRSGSPDSDHIATPASAPAQFTMKRDVSFFGSVRKARSANDLSRNFVHNLKRESLTGPTTAGNQSSAGPALTQTTSIDSRQSKRSSVFAPMQMISSTAAAMRIVKPVATPALASMGSQTDVMPPRLPSIGDDVVNPSKPGSVNLHLITPEDLEAAVERERKANYEGAESTRGRSKEDADVIPPPPRDELTPAHDASNVNSPTYVAPVAVAKRLGSSDSAAATPRSSLVKARTATAVQEEGAAPAAEGTDGSAFCMGSLDRVGCESGRSTPSAVMRTSTSSVPLTPGDQVGRASLQGVHVKKGFFTKKRMASNSSSPVSSALGSGGAATPLRAGEETAPGQRVYNLGRSSPVDSVGSSTRKRRPLSLASLRER